MQSDGTPWRPLVHVRDISRAFLAVLEAPRSTIHDEAFNIGSTDENYQVRDVADIVQSVVPGCSVRYLEGAGPDPRCYRVECGKLDRHLPGGFKTEWNVRRGAQELYDAFSRHGLTRDQFAGYMRINRIKQLMAEGQLDTLLRREPSAAAAAV
jgi:nucleoside-diphosphate-sugar epimerase